MKKTLAAVLALALPALAQDPAPKAEKKAPAKTEHHVKADAKKDEAKKDEAKKEDAKKEEAKAPEAKAEGKAEAKAETKVDAKTEKAPVKAAAAKPAEPAK